MTKNKLILLSNRKKFVGYIRSIGYQQVKNSNTHMIFKCKGKNVLSIPVHGKTISTGVLRNLVKLILNESYYN